MGQAEPFGGARGSWAACRCFARLHAHLQRRGVPGLTSCLSQPLSNCSGTSRGATVETEGVLNSHTDVHQIKDRRAGTSLRGAGGGGPTQPHASVGRIASRVVSDLRGWGAGGGDGVGLSSTPTGACAGGVACWLLSGVAGANRQWAHLRIGFATRSRTCVCR